MGDSDSETEALFDILGVSEICFDDEEECIGEPVSIRLPNNVSRHNYPPASCLAFRCDNVVSRSDCNMLIQTARRMGLNYITEAQHVAEDGTTFMIKIQDPNPHKVSVFELPSFTSRFWPLLRSAIFSIIQPFIARDRCGPALGLNPRLRVLKYDLDADDRFEPHYDATTGEVDGVRSLLTVLLYLNDGGGVDFDGGETLFLDAVNPLTAGKVAVVPKAGTVVIFEHDLYHSGAPLHPCPAVRPQSFQSSDEEGEFKYILRTDIMFAADLHSTPEAIAGRDDLGNEDTTGGTADGTLGITSVAALLDRLNLARLAPLLDEAGMLCSLDSFCVPGEGPLRQLLADLGVEAREARALLAAAFEIKTAGSGARGAAPAQWQGVIRQ